MYFIATNGRVYSDNRWNRQIPRLEIENNLFETRDDAWRKAFELEEYEPMMFYGKPKQKKHLYRH